ncbi:MAG: DNA-deoxyinosine glycosylase [Bacteroidetes bacterium]|nr:DNA-deoxyinosine glycosylase [Bacteroidota bacterium]
MEINCLPSLTDTNTHTIILGTIPGVESLNAKEYYANVDNIFWDIVFRTFPPIIKCDELVMDMDLTYKDKTSRLLSHGFGMWDTIKTCTRESGSSDRKLKDVELNDFDDFFEINPQIEFIMFNGIKAEDYFKRKYKSLYKKIGHQLMSSTSGQNPTNPFLVLKQWKEIYLSR